MALLTKDVGFWYWVSQHTTRGELSYQMPECNKSCVPTSHVLCAEGDLHGQKEHEHCMQMLPGAQPPYAKVYLLDRSLQN